MMALLSPAVWRAVAVAVAMAALVGMYAVWTKHQRNIGRAEVRAEWQADRLNIAEQNRLLLMARDKATGQLQAQADKQRGIANAEKIALNLRVAGLVDSLRDRPDRPADGGAGSVPPVAGAGSAGPGNSGCTGSGLFRPDAAVLIGFAHDIGRLQLALASCRAQRQADIEAVNR